MHYIARVQLSPETFCVTVSRYLLPCILSEVFWMLHCHHLYMMDTTSQFTAHITCLQNWRIPSIDTKKVYIWKNVTQHTESSSGKICNKLLASSLYSLYTQTHTQREAGSQDSWGPVDPAAVAAILTTINTTAWSSSFPLPSTVLATKSHRHTQSHNFVTQANVHSSPNFTQKAKYPFFLLS